MLSKEQLKPILEALLFASADPLSPAELKKLIKIKASDPISSEEVPLIEQKQEDASQTSEQNPEVSLLSGQIATDEAHLSKAALSPDTEIAAVISTEEDAMAQLLKKQDELNEEVSAGEIRQVLDDLCEEYKGRAQCGFELIEVARGYQFRTRPAYSSYIRNMFKTPKPRFSAPSLETLSIVAYQQPVTKLKIEEIRGVESGGVMKTLLERDLIRIVGRSEEVGKPVLYGTTRRFLEVFGLASLGELPTLRDLAALETIAVVNEDTAEVSVNDDEFISIPSATSSEGETLILTDEAADMLLAELDSSMDKLKDAEKRIVEKPAETPTTVERTLDHQENF